MAGAVGKDNRILGAARSGNTEINIDLGHPSLGIVFVNAALLGADHILEGYDHLLFLLSLLLPASLIARSGHWNGYRTPRDTAHQLLRIITAFTIGHSLTLIAATIWHFSLPPAPVEVAIAISVLISGLHALRPLLPGREPTVALLFGLIHGLAFATLLADIGAGQSSGAISLLGFNLGIEIVQLCIVAVIVAPLFVLLRTRSFAWLRIAGGWFAVAAALAWIINRTTGDMDRVVDWFEAAMAHAPWLIAVLILLATARTVRAGISASCRPLMPRTG